MKQKIKALLQRNKVRRAVYIFQAPISYVVISISGLFDKRWYELQCNVIDRAKLPLGSYLLHYLLAGRRKGYTPHPFFVPEYFDPRNWHRSMVDPLARYIIDAKNWQKSTSSLYVTLKIKKGRGPALRRAIGDKRSLFAALEQYQQQEAMRDKTRPVEVFDEQAEQDWLARYPIKSDTAPLVSIIMPTWNRETLIMSAIASVRAQTYQNWELLIVDDGSTDNTIERVQELQKEDGRIHIFEANHGGVCKARNLGIEKASGKWVAFLDSDNTWTPHHLQAIILGAEGNDAQAVYDAIRMNRGDATPLFRTTAPDASLLQIGNYIDLNALAVCKSILDEIGSFDERLRRMVDYDLVCRISAVVDLIYAPVVGVEYTDHGDATRITASEPVSWDGVVKSKNFVSFQQDVQDDLLSIIVTIKNDVRTARRLLDSLLLDSKKWDFPYEIILADSSSSPGMTATLQGYVQCYEHLVHVRFPASHDNVLGANYGLAQASGEYAMVIEQRMVIESGAVEVLYRKLRDLGDALYSPVHLKPSRTIHTAGEVWTDSADSVPIHLLEHHPVSDIAHAQETWAVPMGVTGMFAAKKSILQQVQGLDALLSTGFEVHDLSLRLAEKGIETRIVRDAHVINMDERRGWNTKSEEIFIDRWSKRSIDCSDIWKKFGFVVVRYDKVDSSVSASGVLPRVVRQKCDGELRWAIKISSPADERRFAWGDTHYAESLKSELEALGQCVAIDYHNHHVRPTSYLDDVVLDIRGLDEVTPQEGKINLMWVISHPEKLTKESFEGFDRVYAAGKKWAEDMGVTFMPQCTDTKRFHPEVARREELADKVVFVGNSRNIARPVVMDVIAAGIDIAVFGQGWEQFIDQKYIKGKYVPNEKLASVYVSARAVLNDHWQDMREQGFISNRLFDATAAGAYVISDDIGDVSDIFGAAVARYVSVDEMISLVDRRPSSAELQRVAGQVAAKHSFATRAKQLLDDVRTLSK